jgi:hypothetical protein
MMDAAAMLELLASSKNGKLSPNVMLQQLVADADPEVARLVGTFLTQQQEDDDEEPEPERERTVVVNEGPALVALRADVDAANARIDALERELQEHRERNDAIADALGACPECWGDDRLCPTCSGRGRPGSATPSRQAFERYLAPLLRRLDDARRARASVQPQVKQKPPMER